MVFQWVEKIREILQAIKSPEKEVQPKPQAVESLDMALVSLILLIHFLGDR